MPTKSSFPDVAIPDVDLWGLMFDRKNNGFSDDQGGCCNLKVPQTDPTPINIRPFKISAADVYS